MEIFGINFNEFEMIRFIGGQGGDRPPPSWHWCLGLVLPDVRPTEIGKFFEIVR